MARTNNLSNFLTDVSDAIKQKIGDNTPIPASDFDTKIASIETGGHYQEKSLTITQNGNINLLPDSGYDAMSKVSMSVNVTLSQDATTATAKDLLSPKTCYSNGVKLIGSLRPTYTHWGTVRDEAPIVNNTGEIIYGITEGFYCVTKDANSSSKINIYEVNGTETGEKIMSVDLVADIGYSSATINDIDISDISVNVNAHYIYNVAVTCDTGSNYGWDIIRVNLRSKNYTRLGYGTGAYGFYKENSPNIRFATNSNDKIVKTRYYGSGYRSIHEIAFGKIVNNTVNFFASNTYDVPDYGDHHSVDMALLDVRDNGYVGVYSTWWIYDPYKTFVNKVYYVDWANGTYSEYLSTSDKICLGDDYFIKNNEFYFYTDKTTAIATLNNYTYDANYGYSLGYYDNLISFVPSSNKIYVYKRVNTATFNLVSTEDYVSDGRYYVGSRNLVAPKLTSTGLYYETSKNSGVGVKALIHDDADSRMLKLVTPNTTLYSTFDADAAASNVLLNKVFYNDTGKVTGTMPNNGTLTYIPSTSQQSIPEGYTSGGTIAAVTSAVDNNIQASNIKSGVSILGVTGTVNEGVMTESEYNNALDIADDILGDTPYLPYTELQYITGDGNSYINTRTNINTDGYMVIKVLNNNATVAYGKIFGISNTYVLQQNDTSLTNYGVRYSSSGDSQFFNLDMSSSPVELKVTYAGVLTNFSTGTQYCSRNTINHSSNIILFGMTGLGAGEYSKCRLYGFKIYDSSNQLTLDLIPVIRKSDNAICMYDKVSNLFYTNSGNGSFIAGPEKE